MKVIATESKNELRITHPTQNRVVAEDEGRNWVFLNVTVRIANNK